MVRDATRRAAKFEGKIDADVMRSRITALKDSMVEQMQAKAAELATLEANIKSVVENASETVYSHQIPAYLNVGREIYKKSKNFTGKTFEGEATAILCKWHQKGLKEAVLTDIAKLFGITWDSTVC
jgi:TRAP-type mannitol/chloroaromatic compound transport system substrate-binding protein